MAATGLLASGGLRSSWKWLLLGLVPLLSAARADAAGADFYTVTPCRIVDTRNPAGPLGGPSLAGGTTRGFSIAGRCGVSTAAVAVALNVTVVPQGGGYLVFWPTGTPAPQTSTINFRAGVVRANNAVLPLGAAGGLTVSASASSEVILDVTGYFADAALETTTAAPPAFNPPPGSYTGEQAIEIVTSTPGAQIRYTTDGSAPSPTAGTLYAGR